MTTIAFDGQIIATDTRSTLGGTIVADQRIRKMLPVQIENGTKRPYRFVYAFCGSLPLFPSIVRWHAAGADPTSNPFLGDDGSSLIVIDATNPKKPKIAEYHSAGRGLPLNFSAPIAFGSGQEIARTALDLGVSSVVAVEKAVKFDTYSGLPIEAFDVRKWRWLKKARPAPANSADLIASFKDGVKHSIIEATKPKADHVEEAHNATEGAIKEARGSRGRTTP